MDTLKCFRYDQWLDVTADQLEPSDQIIHQGMPVIVTGKPQLIDGKWHVPAEQPEPQPIKVDLSGGTLARCMDYAGTGLAVFPDGTAILADLEWTPGYVYSPRLPKADLEAFCTKHLDRYEAFYDANRDQILGGVSVAMEPWWIAGSTVTETPVQA
ncbi:hypothetical protein VQ574_20870 (plasmid) [Stutzerimonas frequens]|uniref:hypothetical protein n=1 Tax=Stutzerimonas frequens TaxID=2968969 RepID=UPI002DB835A4|nr:hypothetical protein [Stutzerimonas frequens]WRW29393.1 hypothetical protein VQ574_20870 [Stutzerimonas frequens]